MDPPRLPQPNPVTSPAVRARRADDGCRAHRGRRVPARRQHRGAPPRPHAARHGRRPSERGWLRLGRGPHPPRCRGRRPLPARAVRRGGGGGRRGGGLRVARRLDHARDRAGGRAGGPPGGPCTGRRSRRHGQLRVEVRQGHRRHRHDHPLHAGAGRPAVRPRVRGRGGTSRGTRDRGHDRGCRAGSLVQRLGDRRRSAHPVARSVHAAPGELPRHPGSGAHQRPGPPGDGSRGSAALPRAAGGGERSTGHRLLLPGGRGRARGGRGRVRGRRARWSSRCRPSSPPSSSWASR